MHFRQNLGKDFPSFLANAEEKGYFRQKMAENRHFLSFFAQIDGILGYKMTKNENFEKSPREVLVELEQAVEMD